MRIDVAIYTGRKITAAREELGQSQAALAEALSLLRPTLNKIENAAGRTNIERLCTIAFALQIEPAKLLPTLAEMEDMIGFSSLDKLERIEIPKGEDYLAAVVDGARKYVAEHGLRPRTDGGDASGYVGFAATWSGINSALLKGSNGVDPIGGLHGLLDQEDVGKRRRRA